MDFGINSIDELNVIQSAINTQSLAFSRTAKMVDFVVGLQSSQEKPIDLPWERLHQLGWRQSPENPHLTISCSKLVAANFFISGKLGIPPETLDRHYLHRLPNLEFISLMDFNLDNSTVWRNMCLPYIFILRLSTLYPGISCVGDGDGTGQPQQHSSVQLQDEGRSSCGAAITTSNQQCSTGKETEVSNESFLNSNFVEHYPSSQSL